MAKAQQSSMIQTELGRPLGLVSALSIGVGTMIAAGIFTLSGLAIRNVGSSAVISFGIAALVSLFTALSYCEFVSIYPRSGEGYLYARKTFSAPLAYLVGLALFLGYTSSCAFYISSLSSYFIEFIVETPVESISGIVVLIGLIFLNVKGTRESGGFQVVVTAAKVILLIWFIAGGIRFIQTTDIIEKFSTDIVDIAQTSALVFITFFGFSAIAASAGEVKKPVKNIPRAIFWSVGIVTVLYVFVIMVTIAANLNAYTEAAMGVAARKFLGGIGGMVIVGGAIFSMISASNASIMAGSRVALAMSQLGHLPRELGLINRRTRTPIMALFAVGGLILLFTIILPLESLAHFADTVLLIALIMVNLALIVHRRKYPDIQRPFRVPLVPLIPALGILANLYLLFQLLHHTGPLLLAISCLVLGVLGFLTWKGAESEARAIPGEPSRLALGSFAVDKNDKRPRILVPVSNPANVPALIQIAATLAKAENAVIVALRVMNVPEQMPLDYKYTEIKNERVILDIAQEEAAKHGVPATSILRIAHGTAKAILESARERHVKTILIGWKGYSSSADKILGRVTDAVVTHAKRDILLVRLSEEKKIRDILLPTAGGEHARAAEHYGADLALAGNGNLTVCRVEPAEKKYDGEMDAVKEELAEAQARIRAYNGVVAEQKIVFNKSIVDGILEEADHYDTLMVGATQDSIYQQILFGSIPEQLARTVRCNVIMVKHHHPVKALIGRVLSEGSAGLEEVKEV